MQSMQYGGMQGMMPNMLGFKVPYNTYARTPDLEFCMQQVRNDTTEYVEIWRQWVADRKPKKYKYKMLVPGELEQAMFVTSLVHELCVRYKNQAIGPKSTTTTCMEVKSSDQQGGLTQITVSEVIGRSTLPLYIDRERVGEEQSLGSRDRPSGSDEHDRDENRRIDEKLKRMLSQIYGLEVSSNAATGQEIHAEESPEQPDSSSPGSSYETLERISPDLTGSPVRISTPEMPGSSGSDNVQLCDDNMPIFEYLRKSLDRHDREEELKRRREEDKEIWKELDRKSSPAYEDERRGVLSPGSPGSSPGCSSPGLLSPGSIAGKRHRATTNDFDLNSALGLVSHSSNVEYHISGLFMLASLVFASIGLKQFRSFQTPARVVQEPLMQI